MSAPADPHRRFDFEPPCDPGGNSCGGAQIPAHRFLAIRPPHSIVHIPHYSAHFAVFQQKPVAAVEIQVREMLGGQRANRQALACSRAMGCDYAAQKTAEEPPVLETAFEKSVSGSHDRCSENSCGCRFAHTTGNGAQNAGPFCRGGGWFPFQPGRHRCRK